MKKYLLLFAIILIIISTAGCLSEGDKSTSLDEYRKYELKTMGISLSGDVLILSSTDTHDDFIGDGVITTTYKLTNAQYNEVKVQIKNSQYWSFVKKRNQISSFIDEGIKFNSGYFFLRKDSDKEMTKAEVVKMKENLDAYENYICACIDEKSKVLYFYQWNS